MSTEAAPPLLSHALSAAQAAEVLSLPPAWFAVVDACDEPAVLEHLEIQRGESVGGAPAPFQLHCLYSGDSAEQSWDIAPYVAALTPAIIQWIADRLVDRPWGWLCQVKVELTALRTHLKKQLYVAGPENTSMYFRFYDPRVLPGVLPTCSSHDLMHFFGPLERILLLQPGGDWRSLSLSPSLSVTRSFVMPSS